MEVRYVISAVEKVIDVDLPVAIDVVGSTVEVVQLADAEGRCASRPRNASKGAACGSRFTNTKHSQVSTRMGMRPFSARSKFCTPSNSGMPLRAPSRPYFQP